MLKDRLAAAKAVSDSFLRTEAAVDSAALLAANCMATMLDERSRARLPVGTGLKALQLVSEAAADLVKARRQLVEAHRELVETRDEIGLGRILSYGDTSECPPLETTGTDRGRPHLASVA